MKKILIAFVVCIMSICAYAKDFHPYCQNGDGVSYVQGRTKSLNGSSKIILEGYGNYKNATVLVIVYYWGSDGEEHEGDRTTCTIKDGKGETGLNLSSNISNVKIQVANYCK